MQAVPLPRIAGSPTVMFSLLRPGARIEAHTGVYNTRLVCHLPLIVPPGLLAQAGARGDCIVTVDHAGRFIDFNPAADRVRVASLRHVKELGETQAEQALKHYQFDKVVLGVDGFDLKTGLSTHFEAEATLNRLMCEVAREVVVVTDSSKFERRGFHLICSAMQVHTLVTDAGIPPLYVEELTRMGVQVHIIS